MASFVPAGLAAAGSIIGGITGGKGAKKQAKAIQQAQQQQLAFLTANQNRQYDLNAPAIGNGNAADSRIAALLNLGGDTAGAQAGFDAYRNSTGYDFRQERGLQAVNQNRFAGGAGQSGDTLKRLMGFNQNLASSEFGNYLQQLGGVSGTGANARGLVAGVGGQTANLYTNVLGNNLQNQLGALQQGTNNQQSTIQNLLNAGLFAYGSSYGK